MEKETHTQTHTQTPDWDSADWGNIFIRLIATCGNDMAYTKTPWMNEDSSFSSNCERYYIKGLCCSFPCYLYITADHFLKHTTFLIDECFFPAFQAAINFQTVKIQ